MYIGQMNSSGQTFSKAGIRFAKRKQQLEQTAQQTPPISTSGTSKVLIASPMGTTVIRLLIAGVLATGAYVFYKTIAANRPELPTSQTAFQSPCPAATSK